MPKLTQHFVFSCCLCRLVPDIIWGLQSSSRKHILLHSLAMKKVWGREYFVRNINFLLPMATNIPCNTPEATGHPGGRSLGYSLFCSLSTGHKKVISSMDALIHFSLALQKRQVPKWPVVGGRKCRACYWRNTAARFPGSSWTDSPGTTHTWMRRDR